MSKKKDVGLNGHTEIHEDVGYRAGKTNPTWLTITRHMHSRKKTYFMYWFKNPRSEDQRNNEEPDIYRWHFRIRWDKGPLLQRHVQYVGNSRPSHWENVRPDEQFNVFEQNGALVIERIKGIILEYELLHAPPIRKNTSNKEDL